MAQSPLIPMSWCCNGDSSQNSQSGTMDANDTVFSVMCIASSGGSLYRGIGALAGALIQETQPPRHAAGYGGALRL